jgi:hypothetical protein
MRWGRLAGAARRRAGAGWRDAQTQGCRMTHARMLGGPLDEPAEHRSRAGSAAVQARLAQHLSSPYLGCEAFSNLHT